MTGSDRVAAAAAVDDASGGAAVLAAVDQLLAADQPGNRRTAVRLLRVAVEAGVDDLWRAVGRPALCLVSGRAQFLVLPQVLDAATARQAAAVWGALSAAGHHHAYELTPTAAELAGWRADAARCLIGLADPTLRRPTHAPS